MWKKILLGIGAVLALLLIVVAMQSSTFHIARTAQVAAPPEIAFEQVNVLRNWEPWNPWLKVDPAVKKTYEGPAAGKDAHFHWEGNAEVGEGMMTIVESRPHELVKLRLDFIKPFTSTATAQFTFVPQGDATQVTWSMDGDKNFMAKALHLVLDMDSMIGTQFEKGLADLSQAAQAAQAANAGQKPAE